MRSIGHHGECIAGLWRKPIDNIEVHHSIQARCSANIEQIIISAREDGSAKFNFQYTDCRLSIITRDTDGSTRGSWQQSAGIQNRIPDQSVSGQNSIIDIDRSRGIQSSSIQQGLTGCAGLGKSTGKIEDAGLDLHSACIIENKLHGGCPKCCGCFNQVPKIVERRTGSTNMIEGLVIPYLE